MNHKSILLRGQILEFNKPLTMGVLNITKDSFYSGSRFENNHKLIEKVEEMLAHGMDILDIGAYSTRPGADDIPEGQEMSALTNAIQAVKKEYSDLPISADTFRSSVARAAVSAGADLINDIGGGNLDADMFNTVAQLNVPYILMHSKGNPQTMKGLTQYNDVVNDVVLDLSTKINTLRKLGVKDIIIDPGFGFAKSISQNYKLLRRLEEFEILECPILVGISRKSMIWKTLGTSAEEALNGTTILNTIALTKGADILRVHDVKEAREAVTLVDKLKEES